MILGNQTNSCRETPCRLLEVMAMQSFLDFLGGPSEVRQRAGYMEVLMVAYEVGNLFDLHKFSEICEATLFASGP